MQHLKENDNDEIKEAFRAFCVNSAYEELITKEYCRKDGHTYGYVSIIPSNTHIGYKGDILLVAKDANDTHAFAIAELYDIRFLRDITDEEWETNPLLGNREFYDSKRYGWCLRNVRKVAPMPCKCRYDYQWLYFDDGDIMILPTALTKEEIERIYGYKQSKWSKIWECLLSIARKSLILFLKVLWKVARLKKLHQG